MRQALRVCAEGVPGPVFIEFPIEVLWPQDMIDVIAAAPTVNKDKAAAANKPWTLQSAKSELLARAGAMYLKWHFTRVFDGAFDPVPPTAVASLAPPTMPATSKQVTAVLMALAQAQRPLFLLGSQSIKGTSVMALRKAVEHMGIPTYLSGMARGLLGAAHPLQMRHKRREALAQADVVVFSFCLFFFFFFKCPCNA